MSEPPPAKPTIYAGVSFRSRLEANWAAMFDSLGIYWRYEPQTFALPGGAYVPDFYLPNLRVWCEAKGPGNERLWKPQRLHAQLAQGALLSQESTVIILRDPDPFGYAVWEPVDPTQHTPVVVACHHCGLFGFTGKLPSRQEFCRRCWAQVRDRAEQYLTAAWVGLDTSLYLPMERAEVGQ